MHLKTEASTISRFSSEKKKKFLFLTPFFSILHLKRITINLIVNAFE